MATRNGLIDVTDAAGPDELTFRNRAFYDRLWTEAELVGPDRFATWPLVRSLLPGAPSRLEIAPGLRPRLPLAGTVFLDISTVALRRLATGGGQAAAGSLTALPFPDRRFDLVCALDVVEHVADDEAAWRELARVCRTGAALLLSVPLHPANWTAFDDIVGHSRRYEPTRLLERLAANGFAVERSAAFGMKPRSRHLTALGMWFLARVPGHAMCWYNRVFFPLALRRQVLTLRDGPSATDGASEVFLVCRRV